MKKILLIFIILFSLIACESKKGKSNEKSEAETEKKRNLLIENINLQYLSELSKCSQNANAVTEIEGKTEFWEICDLDNKNKIIQIELYDSDILYQEVYFVLNGKLRYVKNTELLIPKNKFSQMILDYEWYFENEELVAITFNNGDINNYDYSIVIEDYNKRILELHEIEK